MNEKRATSRFPEETFAFGESIGRKLKPGDAVLLSGGLGAGKTLLTKGIMAALGFDEDEVTSPSFTLVNKYETAEFDVFHIDLWRLEGGIDNAFAVGLEEIVETDDAVVIIEWADLLGDFSFPGKVFTISITGDGDSARNVRIRESA